MLSVISECRPLVQKYKLWLRADQPPTGQPTNSVTKDPKGSYTRCPIVVYELKHICVSAAVQRSIDCQLDVCTVPISRTRLVPRDTLARRSSTAQHSRYDKAKGDDSQPHRHKGPVHAPNQRRRDPAGKVACQEPGPGTGVHAPLNPAILYLNKTAIPHHIGAVSVGHAPPHPTLDRMVPSNVHIRRATRAPRPLPEDWYAQLVFKPTPELNRRHCLSQCFRGKRQQPRGSIHLSSRGDDLRRIHYMLLGRLSEQSLPRKKILGPRTVFCDAFTQRINRLPSSN
jgi:hypothetical protein